MQPVWLKQVFMLSSGIDYKEKTVDIPIDPSSNFLMDTYHCKLAPGAGQKTFLKKSA